MDASHVYVRVWALGCFHSLNYQYPNLSEGADRVGGQLRGDKECPFSGVNKSGRVWRKVPESDARSVTQELCEVDVLGPPSLIVRTVIVDVKQHSNKRAQSSGANSKHWFTASFLQSLPYLVTP